MLRHLVVPCLVLGLLAGTAASLRADDTDGPQAPPPAEESPGVRFETTLSFDEALARAKETGKPLFIDFWTDWCSWCHKLERETFRDAGVARLMQGFVNLRVDAEKGEGPELARRFGVRGFPTLIVVGPDGLEVDRILGFVPAEVFADEIRRIQSGEGTLAGLRRKYEASPKDVEAGMAYGAKLALSRPAEAAALYEKLAASSSDAGDDVKSRIRLEHAVALLNAGSREEAASAAEKILDEFPGTPAAAKVAQRAGRAFLALNDVPRALAFVEKARGVVRDDADKIAVEELSVSVHRSAIASALRRQAELAGDDANVLNEVAWSCFEQKVNVREAIGWARKAVELSDRDPSVLDTLANLLWLVGEQGEAMKLETEAVRKAQGAMKVEFEVNVAKWKAELDHMRKLEDGGAEEPSEEPVEDVPPPPIDGTR